MNQVMTYTVRILYRFVGDETRHTHEMKVTARDETEAQRTARTLWLDNTPAGEGVQWLGSKAELDNGQLSLF